MNSNLYLENYSYNVGLQIKSSQVKPSQKIANVITDWIKDLSRSFLDHIFFTGECH